MLIAMECHRTRSPLSNFISMRMKEQPKIRIKLPNLLVNTMQKRVAHHHGDHNNKKCARKVSLVFTNPFAKHNAPENSSFKSNEASTNGSKLRPLKMRLPVLSFLTKSISLKKLMRSETETTGVDGVGTQESSGHLVRVLQKPMSSNCRKLKMAMSFMRARKMKTKEKLDEDSKQEDNSSEYELCKKRILMGGKCRSGSLHYDQNGYLLSDVLL